MELQWPFRPQRAVHSLPEIPKDQMTRKLQIAAHLKVSLAIVVEATAIKLMDSAAAAAHVPEELSNFT